MIDYTFSKHCLQRYAERMQDYDSAIDINVFIASHGDDIKERIIKLIEYSEHIYCGKSTSEYNQAIVDVYLNKNGWAIIVDHKKNNVITMYRITLNLDDELDKEYLLKISNRLSLLKEKEETNLMGIAAQEETYTAILTDNMQLENELRSQLKALEEQDKAYKEVIESLHTSRVMAEKPRREFIARILGRKVF